MLSFMRRVSSLKTLCNDLITDTLSKRSIQQFAIRNRCNPLGYIMVKSKNDLIRSKRPAHPVLIASFSSNNNTTDTIEQELSTVQFERISDETLESLTEYFDELVEAAAHLPDADVSYGDGVLTVKFGDSCGTYVINRQTPNKQIWLSSPKSGPKRYDFINGKWIYKHDGKSLHQLLNDEIPLIVKRETCFDKCLFSGRGRHATMNNI